MLSASGCRVKLKDLPTLLHPHVCELTALKQIDHANERLRREEFAGGKVTSPFYLLVKVCDVENRGTVRIAVYTTLGERLRNVSFHFGEKGKFYPHIICYDRLHDIPEGIYRVCIFVNERLRDERPLKVFPGGSG